MPIVLVLWCCCLQVWAQPLPPLPIIIEDCYLQPAPGRVYPSPGMASSSGSGYWNGLLALRNQTRVGLGFKNLVLHVLDGYSQPLFDLHLPGGFLKPMSAAEMPLTTTYLGGVVVFRFSADLIVMDPAGREEPIHLPAFERSAAPGRR